MKLAFDFGVGGKKCGKIWEISQTDFENQEVIPYYRKLTNQEINAVASPTR